MNFENLIQNIEITHQNLQTKVSQTINQSLTLRNWCIGAYIVEYEQKGKDKAEYGKQLLHKLAASIKTKNIKGLGKTDLKNCRIFYNSYPHLRQVFESLKLLDTDTFNNQIQIGQTLSDQFKVMDKDKVNYFIILFRKISYSHFVVLMSIDNPTKRQYYELLTLKTTLSIRELKRQIDTLAYERTGLSQNKELSIEQIQKTILPQTAEDAIKDIYVFEFLGLDSKEVVTENDLEKALIQHLQEFILELGNGFCFEARQKRILIGEDYFFIDLVFYHRILKCHVLIELKIDKMHIGHIAQLKTYLNYYNKEIKLEDDNASIGILLVTDKNQTLVEYALPEKQNELFISKYKLQLPSEQQLLDFIQNEIKNIEK